ncbi:hypothetical protein [Nannocystis radixulma]|uniref:Uncharacterized protein n=1 Tax=Nannocystis radixulma TaxID=2995305 RepID=A0ABT5AYZ2_9BACT|nr:hypothetical protein [Nannocystis radixulma]MDC0666157.1 hypothetical protein [Nannocystis radixulma]
MRPCLHVPTLAVGMSLATCLMTARAEVMPEAEYDSQEIDAVTELSGVSRFPDHAFYVFPAYCTQALAKFSASLESGDDEPEIDPLFYYDDKYDGRPNYLVVSDGTLPRWTSGNTPCISSTLYSLAREVAAGVDLENMPLAEMHRFFTEDPRVFRSTFVFQDSPLYAAKYSRLRTVHEVVRILRVGPSEIVTVLDAATYRFDDGTEQTLRLAHTDRPGLPFKPLKPEKIDKYAGKYARWEARQPLEPPPAPRLPVSDDPVEPPASPTADETAGSEPQAAPPAAGTSTADPVASAQGTGTAGPVVSPPASSPAPVSSPAPSPSPAESEIAAPGEDGPEDMDEEPPPTSDPAWPLGAAIAGALALVVIVALTRRPRTGA